MGWQGPCALRCGLIGIQCVNEHRLGDKRFPLVAGGPLRRLHSHLRFPTHRTAKTGPPARASLSPGSWTAGPRPGTAACRFTTGSSRYVDLGQRFRGPRRPPTPAPRCAGEGDPTGGRVWGSPAARGGCSRRSPGVLSVLESGCVRAHKQGPPGAWSLACPSSPPVAGWTGCLSGTCRRRLVCGVFVCHPDASASGPHLPFQTLCVAGLSPMLLGWG